MTFTEFLRAAGQERLALEIEAFEWTTGPAPPAPHPVVHRRLLELLRLYHFVGGMPEAVKVYAESRNLRAVSAVHAGIIDTWRDDFPKYATRRDLTRMLRVFNFAARHAGRKVKYSNVSPDDQSGTIRRDIDLLAMARVIARVTHSQCSGLPLQADLKEKVFKLIFLDVGLMNAVCGLGWQTIAGQTETQLVNAGPGAEQLIGQHLQFLLADRPNRELTYWLREGRSNNAEVDYVCEIGGRIVPIEVKAGRTGTLKSLHQFVAEKQVPFAVRFDTDLPALHHGRSGSAPPPGLRKSPLPAAVPPSLPGGAAAVHGGGAWPPGCERSLEWLLWAHEGNRRPRGQESVRAVARRRSGGAGPRDEEGPGRSAS